MGTLDLTPDLCRVRATGHLALAINQLKHNHIEDAFTLYGNAMVYEELYDAMQSNQEINSLYRDSEIYRKLCLDWVNAKRYLLNNKTT